MNITINSTWAIVFGVLWSIDNAVALMPGIQANNTFQLINNILVNIKNYFFSKTQQY